MTEQLRPLSTNELVLGILISLEVHPENLPSPNLPPTLDDLVTALVHHGYHTRSGVFEDDTMSLNTQTKYIEYLLRLSLWPHSSIEGTISRTDPATNTTTSESLGPIDSLDPKNPTTNWMLELVLDTLVAQTKPREDDSEFTDED